MKLLVAAVLSVFSASIFANSHDVLTVNTQKSNSTYVGDIGTFDKEDAIKQVEINNATVTVTPNTDYIFENGFELYNVNWVWIGDDTNNNEFGGTGQCTENDYTDHYGNVHVDLNCYEISNEPTKAG